MLRINRKLSASCVDVKGCADARKSLPRSLDWTWSYVPNRCLLPFRQGLLGAATKTEIF